MALSPWPTTPAALAAATATLKAAIGAPDDPATQRLGATAAALVERYAPAAPDVVKDEAVIRCAGWLLESPSAGIRRSSVGPVDTTYSPAITGALRASGSMALLGSWKVRRAGVIG